MTTEAYDLTNPPTDQWRDEQDRADWFEEAAWHYAVKAADPESHPGPAIQYTEDDVRKMARLELRVQRLERIISANTSILRVTE